jgi:hypothetical protein
MQNTFTIEEIRKYILSQDSLGDVLYNLSVSKILEANEPEEDEEDDDDDDEDDDDDDEDEVDWDILDEIKEKYI